MKKLLSVLSVVSLSALMFISCSKDSDTTGTNNGGGSVPSTSNTMTVTIDGTAYTLTAFGIKVTNGGNTAITIAGSDASGKVVGLSLSNISAAGTYDVGTFDPATSTGANMTYQYNDGSGNGVAYATLAGLTSVGKLTITELTATSMKGTFNATLTKISGSGANTVVITKGGVNSTIQ